MIAFAIFNINYISAQSIILGKVINKSNNDPVQFANIVVNGIEKFGTASDLQGNFRLKINSLSTPVKLDVSCIGFENNEIIVHSITQDTLVIFMQQLSYPMPEVSVKPILYLSDPEVIFQRAIRRFNKNYSSKPYTLYGLYQDNFQDFNSNKILNVKSQQVKIDSKKFDARIYDENVATQYSSQKDTTWPELCYDNVNMLLPNYIFPNYGGNHLLCLLNSDPIRNHNRLSFDFVQKLEKDFLKNHQLWLDSISIYNGRITYFLSIWSRGSIVFKYLNITNCKFYESFRDEGYLKVNNKMSRIGMGRLFIDANDYAIVRFIYHNGSLNDRYKFDIEYSKIKDKYYPTNIYLGNKCLINFKGSFNFQSDSKQPAISCKGGGIKYIENIFRNYINMDPDNKQLIQSILNQNTIHINNIYLHSNIDGPSDKKLKETFHPVRFRDGIPVQTVGSFSKMDSLVAYSKALEEVQNKLEFNNYQKILHHRRLVITRIVDSTNFIESTDFSNSGNISEFIKYFQYIGDPKCTWYPYEKSIEDYDFSKLINSPASLNKYGLRNVCLIPITSNDEFRYVKTLPKGNYCFDNSSLFHGLWTPGYISTRIEFNYINIEEKKKKGLAGILLNK